MSLLEQPEICRFVLESLQAGVYLVDKSRRILCWNDGAERISGYFRQDVVGRICEESILLHCDEQGTGLCGDACPVMRTIQDGTKREMSVYIRHKAGHLVPVYLWCIAIRDGRGNIAGASLSFEERKPEGNLEVRSQELAAHGCLDAITGLPNQAFTRTRLREHLGRYSEHRLPFSILLISLAEDKAITAIQGHPAAERMLQSAAQTLSNVLRPADFLGRWEGDQLLAILAGRTATPNRLQPIGRLVGLSRIHWWGDSVPVSVLLAAAEPQADDNLESLVARAQAELQKAGHAKPPEFRPAASAQAEG